MTKSKQYDVYKVLLSTLRILEFSYICAFYSHLQTLLKKKVLNEKHRIYIFSISMKIEVKEGFILIRQRHEITFSPKKIMFVISVHRKAETS